MKKTVLIVLSIISAALLALPASADDACQYVGYDRTGLAAELVDVRSALASFPANCSCVGQPESCKYSQKGCLALYDKMICLSTALGVDAKLTDAQVREYLQAYYGVGASLSPMNCSNFDNSGRLGLPGCGSCWLPAKEEKTPDK